MAVPYQAQGLEAQQADGNILLSWTGVVGATSYSLQRGTDGVNFTTIASPTGNQYIDAYPGIGTTFYYQVAGVNTDGTGIYSALVSMVAAPPSEMSLGELRLRSQQTADRVNSDFVGVAEWNFMIRLSMYELYDLLIGCYEGWKKEYVYIPTSGTQQLYPMPDGATNYLGGTYGGASGNPAQAFYKLMGVDLNVNTAQGAYVTVNQFNFIDRNQYVYPNSTSTIYGVNNMRYSLEGSDLMLIPVPAGNQQLKIWYNPRLPALLADYDLTTIGVSGWLRYVIVRAAKYALDKEEGTDTSKLDAELLFLKKRIEEMASNRDVGQAPTISNTRKDSVYGGYGWNGSNGGF